MSGPVVLGGASWNRMIRLDAFPPAEPGTVHACESWEAAGSTGIGKALALTAFGHAPLLHAVLGDDAHGDKVRAFCAARDLSTVIDSSEAPTPHHVNLMDPSGERLSIFAEAGDLDPQIDLARLARPIAAAEAVFVGITPSSVPLLPLVREAPGTVLVDLHDWDGANEWHRPFLARADVVQLSEGRLSDARASMRALGKIAETVVLTRGTKGALILHGGRFTEIPPAPAEMVDTNGAGDVFSVALWDAMRRGLAVAEAGAFAAAAAALSVESHLLVPEHLSREAVAARLAESR